MKGKKKGKVGETGKRGEDQPLPEQKFWL